MLRSLVRILLGVLVLGTIAAAVFVTVLRQPTLTSLPYRAKVRSDAHLLRNHVRFLTRNVLPRSAGHPRNLQRAAGYIAVHFRAAGARTSLQHFDARRARYTNVVAEFGPEDRSMPLLVIGAHYDAFGDQGALPGADDNASGTAGVLELARLLGKRAPSTPVMLVAFSTEEPPFFGSEQMGSAVHALSLAADGRNVRGMISLEMIGFYAEQQSWPNALFASIYPSRGDFIGVAGGWDDRSLTRHVKRAIDGAGGIPVISLTGPRETSDASDHRNYWSRGWPAVIVTDTAFLRNPHYHTKGDTAETLDYDRMARVVDGVFNAALH